MPTRTALSLTLALCVLSACGGERDAPAVETTDAAAATAGGSAATPTAATSTAADPAAEECPYFDSALATGILGVDVIVTGTPATNTCYIATDPRALGGHVTVIPNHTLDAIQTGQTAVEPIEGLGERASWAATSTWEGRDLAGQVGVEQGGNGVTVTLSAPADAEFDDLKGKSIALARAVVAGL
jgi:hypothetical protein